MIRCLIVDDELIAHQILEQYINQTPGLTLVAKCRNALEAFAKLSQDNIDLLFLDIEMPLIDGITLLKTLANPPRVILTTAYTDYALQGYELNVVDYLLKPFSYERFAKAVAKLQATVASLPKQEEETGHLLIKEKGGLLKIPYNKIMYIEASKDYVKIVTAEQQHLAHFTMKALEQELPAGRFARIHKSYIVALQHIKMVKADSVMTINNQTLPVSVNYKDALLAAYKQ